MAGEKKPRYTEYIRELEKDREDIKLELNEHVFINYMRFIEIFKEFREVQSVSLDCYDPCFTSIKASLKDLLSTVSVKKVGSTISTQKNTAEWWQELPDELDTLLADEKYEECIGIIEDTKSIDVKSDCINYKLDFDVHVLKVIEIISKELQKAQVVVPEIYIGYLKRLDAMASAEDAYFIGKSQQIKLYMRRMTITESPVEGIPKQCQVFVSLLRNTATESLKLGLSIPKLYSWMLEELKSIAWEIGESLHIIEKIEELAKVLQQILKSFDALEQIGMCITQEFEYSFIPFIQKRIQDIYWKEESKVEIDIASELWKPQVVQFEGSSSVLRMTGSSWNLYQQLIRILEDCVLFNDEHMKCFATLAPIFLKTMQALFVTYVNSDKFDDRKDSKTVQMIVCNLWNLASIVPVLCKKVVERLKVPSMEIPDFLLLETEAKVRGDDILHVFALNKWAEEVPVYITSLQAIPKLMTIDEILKVYNMKHCQFFKEGFSAISSSTDRNSHRIHKYGKTLIEAYVRVLDDLFQQVGGHYHINEISVPGFQQLITDLSVLYILMGSFEVTTSLPQFIEKIVKVYTEKKKIESMLVHLKIEVYQDLYNKLLA